MTAERAAFKRHQQGYHTREIIGSLFFFVVLEVITALCQGKIIKFKTCSIVYFVAFGMYMLFMGMIVMACYKFSGLRMNLYRRVGFDYILQLDNPKVYCNIAAGGVAAGLLHGIIGMGSGHMLSLVLLAYNFSPEVTSATSGYIIFFVGSASLI